MDVTKTTGSALRERFPELVGWLVVGGFAMTLAELLLMSHTEKSQTIAVVMTSAGMLALALGLLAPKLHKLALGLLVVVGASGLFGTYEHFEHAAEEQSEKASRESSALVVQKADFQVTEASEHEHDEHEEESKHGPPPLAPLSVSGLALMGSLGLLASRR